MQHPLSGFPNVLTRHGVVLRSELKQSTQPGLHMPRTCGMRRSKHSHECPASVQDLPVLPIDQQCAQTRQKVLDLLRRSAADGLVLMQGGKQIMRNSDVPYPFRQESDFFYMTGIDDPDFACLVDVETGRFTLLAPELDPAMVVWMGGAPSLEELAEAHGADDAAYMPDVTQLLLRSRPERLYLGAEGSSAAAGLLDLVPPSIRQGADRSRLQEALHAARSTKTAGEMACLREASRVSALAHMAMWRACSPPCHEHQLEAVFTGTALQSGLRHLGYPPIVGAGANSATLHYDRNNAAVRERDLVLVDAGAEFRHYTADISRTFPAGGAFTAVQKDVYQAVACVQAEAIALYQSGRRWQEDISIPTRQLLLGLLADMGLVKGSPEELLEKSIDRVFMPHALGHFLGLDVHDVSPAGPVPKLVSHGQVITCEPGIYFAPSVIGPALADEQRRHLLMPDRIAQFAGFGGIRLEDNIVVLDTMSLNATLQAGLPISLYEVERMCAN